MRDCFSYCVLFALVIGCSSPKKEAEESTDDQLNDKVSATNSGSNSGVDQYRLVIRHIDNRAVVSINDSTIYDSGTLNGEVDTKIDLTDFVQNNMTDLKVEVYNGTPPYITASPSWKIVYDIFVNDELADFVREDSNNGKIGLVYTEEHDLSDIW